MPGNQATYSAIRAKTAAMRARHLSDAQYAELLSKPTVSDVCSYLKNNTVYAPLFEGYNERNLHRGEVETLLDGYMQSEVHKLYCFCGRSAREMLSYTYIRYEIEQLKAILRGILTGTHLSIKYDMQNFFHKKLTVDLEQAAAAGSVREFLNVIADSPYYEVLAPVLAQSGVDLYAFEMLLDVYYFKHMWKVKDKALHGEDKAIVTALFGREIDMLNLCWIYRCKRYYDMDSSLIFPAIIPIHHKISKTALAEMINTADTDGFIKLALQTQYKELFTETDTRFIEQNYTQLAHKRMRALTRKHPYSIASVLGYTHFLELEISRITAAIESIRYGIQI